MEFLERILPFIFVYFVWKSFSKAPRNPEKPKPPKQVDKPETTVPDKDQTVPIDPAELLRQIFFGEEPQKKTAPANPAKAPMPEPARRKTRPDGKREPSPRPQRPLAAGRQMPANLPPHRPFCEHLAPGQALHRSRAELRTALVWSEILAKPLALRDESP